MKVHLVGAGGAGISALAHLYLQRGDSVSGSDMQSSYVTANLAEAGMNVAIGHDAKNLGDADLVVVSSAIRADNPELLAARQRGIKVLTRGKAAAQLCRGKLQVAIAGSHGKTTTTTWAAALLEGADPLVISGGRLPGSRFNSRPGEGDFAVIEADESDGSFLELDPHIAVVTNVDVEHVTRYPNLRSAVDDFIRFAGLVSSTLVACADDPGSAAVLAGAPGETLSYGFSAADIRARDYHHLGGGSIFQVSTPWGSGQVRLPVPGEHNARNALAVIGVGLALAFDLDAVLAALERAQLPGRRLELVANVNGARVYDDYGHHPTEVATTLRAARELCDGRLFCAFQPYRASRLQALLPQFATSFRDADEVLLVPVAPPDDTPIEGVDHHLLARAIIEAEPGKKVKTLKSVDSVPGSLLRRLRKGDVVVCMGIGDVYRAAYLMASRAGAEVLAG